MALGLPAAIGPDRKEWNPATLARIRGWVTPEIRITHRFHPAKPLWALLSAAKRGFKVNGRRSLRLPTAGIGDCQDDLAIHCIAHP